MKITPIQMICPREKWDVKCPYTMKPQGIAVHNTYNNATARQEISYVIRRPEYISFHYAIDDKEVVQGLPENRNNFSCGDGAKGKGNRTQVAIEICYSKGGGKRFDEAEKLAAKFIAQLLKKYNWGVDKVTKHQDYSSKYCPHRTLDRGWSRFLKMIECELEAYDGKLPETFPKFKIGDEVKIIGKKYATGQNVPTWVKAKKHTVKTMTKDKALLKEINSWVFLKDLKPAKTELAVGDVARIREGAIYGGWGSARGKKIPGSVCDKNHKIKQIATHGGVKEALLEDINSWVAVEFLY